MVDSPIPNFGKLHHLGSRNAQFVDTPGEDIEYTEKIDGSQFSFMRDQDDYLWFRSKRADINPLDPGMFEAGVRSITARASLLHPGWIYRGEYLRLPKHNALQYDRVPFGNVYLFRVDTGPEAYLSTTDLQAEAARIDLEGPRVFPSPPEGTEGSVLGGVPMEGYVIKNYSRSCLMTGKYPLMAKWVRPSFREIAGGEFRKANPTPKDLVEQLALDVCPEARMEKAVQHLAEQGLLDNSPRDIPMLMKELSEDIRVEASEYIAEQLLKHHLPHILRKAVRGFPQWYRARIGYGE